MYLETPLKQKYSKCKLSDFVNQTSKVQISEEKDILNYFQQFNVLSKLLVNLCQLDIEGRNKYFWLRFHTEDHKALKERLFAKFPDHPLGSYFNYKEVLQTVWIIFVYYDDKPGVGVPQSSTRRCDTLPPLKACKHDSWAHDHSHCASWHELDCNTPYYQWAEQEDNYDSRASDNFNSEDEAPCHSAQKIKTKTIWFKNHPCKNEDRELEDLVGQLHGLDIWDSAYAAGYARLTHHFPNTARDVLKPEYWQATMATTSFLHQVVPLLPTLMYSYQTMTAPPLPPTPYAYQATLPPLLPMPAQT
jgi:hypothetical protein